MAALFAATPAAAAPITSAVNGIFNDGGTFSGTFTLDGAALSILNSNITTSPFGAFGTTYTSSGTGSPYIQGNSSYVPNDFAVFFTSPTSIFFCWLPGTAAAYSGGAIETYPASCPPQGCSPSWERIDNTVRRVASGSLAPVPEPGSGLLFGFGLATAGAVCLRRRERDSRRGRK